MSTILSFSLFVCLKHKSETLLCFQPDIVCQPSLVESSDLKGAWLWLLAGVYNHGLSPVKVRMLVVLLKGHYILLASRNEPQWDRC